jgi:hypothetical protein
LGAFEELTVLRTIEESPVIVRAEGEAFFRESESGEEQRGEVLEFVGRRRDPDAEPAAAPVEAAAGE